MRFSSHKASNVALLQRQRQVGSGYFEFAIVAIIFAILAGLLLQKMQFYQAEAERLAVERTVTSLRAALANRVTSLFLKGNDSEVAALARQNPMLWLERLPPNYAGETSGGREENLEKGYWYYDRQAATLLYVLNNKDFFGESNVKHLKFKVKFAEHPSNVTKNHEGPGLGGVALERIDE
jgi:general secretion pathway protein G